jgi:hypothetical protein
MISGRFGRIELNTQSSSRKVIFVSLPSVPVTDIPASFEKLGSRIQPCSMPLGILHISSFLKKHNHTVQTGLLDYLLALRNIHTYGNIADFV